MMLRAAVYRAYTALEARSEVHFLDVRRPVLAARLADRNATLPPYTFHVTEAQLDLWWSLFEPPTPDELQSNTWG